MNDVWKFLVPFIISLTSAIPIMYLKLIHFREKDRLFLTKLNQAKLNLSNSIGIYIVLLLMLYIIPALSFLFMDGLSLMTKFGNENNYLLFLTCSFLIFFIFLSLTLFATKKWNSKKKLIMILTFITIISSLFFYCPAFASTLLYLRIYSAWTFIIVVPLTGTIFLMYVVNQTTEKKEILYLSKIVSEEYIKDLDLIHSHMVDDSRALLYDRYRSKEYVFYICDYSAKVYLEFLKVKSEDEDEDEN
ncbi:hypothetical protein [Bacillus mycoides]|uniref:hypothetical protein n=1 Tax=Bacillus mycoides TaxID=1405 RepID=UPI00273CB160|nr:hypothetical protein [Bacillus mycoides]MED1626796.1 hypothetical protein [Bacillus mycoides]